MTTLPRRFWDKVNKTDTCWLWIASKAPNGYGQFWLNERLNMAHRVAYVDARGSIPVGLQLDHLCRVRHCVNPGHLEPVTPRENNHRSPITNGGKTYCKHGHLFSEGNTYITSEGHRKCRTCIFDQSSKQTERKRLLRSLQPTPERTECRNGHEYNDANTIYTSDGRRICRPCRRARHAAYRARKAVTR